MLKARGVIAVDTGLGHLAAALGKPALTLYGPTNPDLPGAFGPRQLHLTSNIECAPCMKKELYLPGPAASSTRRRTSLRGAAALLRRQQARRGLAAVRATGRRAGRPMKLAFLIYSWFPMAVSNAT